MKTHAQRHNQRHGQNTTTAAMDGSGPQDPCNVYLPGRQKHTQSFQDHAELSDRIIQELRFWTSSFQVYYDGHICVKRNAAGGIDPHKMNSSHALGWHAGGRGRQCLSLSMRGWWWPGWIDLFENVLSFFLSEFYGQPEGSLHYSSVKPQPRCPW